MLWALSGCAERVEPVHLVLISIDTLRADHLASYGHPFVRTPHLDRLAAEGFRFESHVSAAPTTLASHAALMTGTWPHTHGAPRNGFVLSADNTLLAEVMKANGFATAGFIGSFPLSRQFGFDQGFDYWDESLSRVAQKEADRGGQIEIEQNQRPADEVTKAAIRWLEEQYDGDQPLFLFLHYFDVHAPYLQPPRFAQMYRDGGAELDGSMASIRRARNELAERRPSALQDRLKRSYAAGVSWVDAEIGRLLGDLQQRGILENAVVVVTSDHGESSDEGWEHWDHGYSVAEATTRTPLIIRMPRGRDGGQTVANLVSNIDLMPSLLELFDIPLPAAVEGISFAALLRGGEPVKTREIVFSEATKPASANAERGTRWKNERKCKAGRTVRWKLVHCPLRNTVKLFDLESDPAERRDAAAENPEIVANLRERLASWSSQSATVTSERDLSEKTRTRLEALGYVEEDSIGPADE